MSSNMNIQQSMDFIKNAQLMPPCDASSLKGMTNSGMSSIVPSSDGSMTACVAGHCIMLFDPSVKEPEMKDMCSSMLFAQLAANGKNKDMMKGQFHPTNWCSTFCQNLGHLGWNVRNMSCDKMDKSEHEGKNVGQCVAKHCSEHSGMQQTPKASMMLEKILMAKGGQHEHASMLMDSCSKAKMDEWAAFAVACIKMESGLPMMHLNFYAPKSPNLTGKVMECHATEMHKGTTSGTFDPKVFSKLRDAVKEQMQNCQGAKEMMMCVPMNA